MCGGDGGVGGGEGGGVTSDGGGGAGAAKQADSAPRRRCHQPSVLGRPRAPVSQLCRAQRQAVVPAGTELRLHEGEARVGVVITAGGRIRV